jgi:hypothetical protein
MEENLPQLDGIVDEDELEDEVDAAEKNVEVNSVPEQAEAEHPHPAVVVEAPERAAVTENNPLVNEETDAADAITVEAIPVTVMSTEVGTTAPLFTLNAVEIVNMESCSGLAIVPLVSAGHDEAVMSLCDGGDADIGGAESDAVVVSLCDEDAPVAAADSDAMGLYDGEAADAGEVGVVQRDDGEDILGRVMNESEIGSVPEDSAEGRFPHNLAAPQKPGGKILSFIR